MNSPTKRTLDMLRREGYECEVVERWNPHAKVRKDLFGFIDVLAMQAYSKGLVGVQTTTASHMASRMKKALASPHLKTWLATGNEFWVHGWQKKGSRYQVQRRRIVYERGVFVIRET